MRELRLKYIINMVSDLGRTAKTDEQALNQAQRRIQEALQKTNTELGLMERLLLRVGRVHTQSAERQANYLARLALGYQEVRRQAEAAATAMQRVAAVGAGASAGVFAVDRMARAPMDYETRLARMANTAFADRDVSGRAAGMRSLDAAITTAVRMGGGTRDAAAEALDALIASGAVSRGTAIRMLPTLTRGGTASGATPTELANIGLRGMQSFRLREEQLPEALNLAMVGGQAGGFELRDMAKELPSILAMASTLGMSGMDDFRRLIASLQAQVIVAGSRPEAANNLLNLLGKIQSPDVTGNLAKFSVNGTARLAKDRAAGVNPLDSFVGLVDEIVSKDAEYRRLQKELQKAGTAGERTATLTSMATLLQGSAIGKVIQDRQALMALVAEMNNRQYVTRVMGQLQGAGTGELDTSFGLMAGTTAFAREQALNEAAIGAQRAFDAAGPALGAVANTATDAARAFPNLTAAVIGATGVFVAAGAALGAAGLVGMLTGRAGNAGGLIGTAGTVAAGGAGLLASKFMSPGMWWMRAGAGAVGPLVGGAIDAYQVAAADGLTAEQRARGYARAGAGTVGGLGGVLGGAALGFMVGGPVGSLIGGIGGGMGGSWGGKKLLDWLWSQDPAANVTGPNGMPLPNGKLELGQGTIDVRVRVDDERTTATADVARDMPAIKLNAGSTNPAGYPGRP